MFPELTPASQQRVVSELIESLSPRLAPRPASIEA
jgi:hypothetical protein